MFITEDTKSKHTNIKTIYNEYWSEKYLQKLLKMLNWKVWEERPSGLIKRGMKCKQIKWI